MKPYVFGVDIGGTTVKLGLFSTDGTLVEKWEIPTHTEENGAQVLPEIAQAITGKLAEKAISADQVEGIGIGVPGPVGADYTVYKCINLGWGVFNVKERMNELLPEIPNVAAGNDANVAALGELWQGGGVVMDGKIVAGANGGAGELGHMTVNPEETVPCNCGKYGCLEQYASANGIVRLAKRMLQESDKPSQLRNLEAFIAKDIYNLARDGEPMAMDIVDRCGDYLGRALSYVSCTIDPDVYIIGGGMSRAGAVVTDTILKYYRKYALHVSTGTTAVIAELGNDAGIYGCARMILA